MRKLLLLIPALLLVLASCKTTEANYKAAYDVAKAAQSRTAASDPDDGLDENTRRLLARDKASATATHIVGSDSLKVTTLFVKMVQGPSDFVPQYSVVLNAFSQVFNAKAMCRRLQENGFPDAYIFQTATPDYYVAAGGSDELADIPAILKKVSQAGQLGTRAGFPSVIRAGGYRKR